MVKQHYARDLAKVTMLLGSPAAVLFSRMVKNGLKGSQVSSRRKPGSIEFKEFWTPAYAGVTTEETFSAPC